MNTTSLIDLLDTTAVLTVIVLTLAGMARMIYLEEQKAIKNRRR